MPGKQELPSTLKKAPAKAQRTWIKAHDNAVKQYGEGERSHRTAFAALKYTFEKKGGTWVAKNGKGPSDPRSKQPGPAKRAGKGETFGGVDTEGNTRKALYERARKAGVKGASKMKKAELARSLARAE